MLQMMIVDMVRMCILIRDFEIKLYIVKPYAQRQNEHEYKFGPSQSSL